MKLKTLLFGLLICGGLAVGQETEKNTIPSGLSDLTIRPSSRDGNPTRINNARTRVQVMQNKQHLKTMYQLRTKRMTRLKARKSSILRKQMTYQRKRAIQQQIRRRR